MIKIILLLLLVVLASSYALGWFYDVGLGDKTTEDFNAEYIYRWKQFFYQTHVEALDRLKAFRTSISKS